MARRLRSSLPDGWFHVMNRGVARRQVFDTVADGEQFVGLLGEVIDDSPIELHSYCLMPNHYHLLVRGLTADLSRVMQALGSNYVRYYNRRNGRDGPLFRSRFHCKPVATDRYVLAVSRYIHRNPLGRVEAERLADYRWSSLAAFVSPAAAPPWLTVDPVLEEVGGSEAYHAFVVRDTRAVEVDLDWAIGTAIEVADLPTRLNTRNLDRCVGAALFAGATVEQAELLQGWMGCSIDEVSELAAQSAGRIGRQPELQAAVDQAARLLGYAA